MGRVAREIDVGDGDMRQEIYGGLDPRGFAAKQGLGIVGALGPCRVPSIDEIDAEEERAKIERAKIEKAKEAKEGITFNGGPLDDRMASVCERARHPKLSEAVPEDHLTELSDRLQRHGRATLQTLYKKADMGYFFTETRIQARVNLTEKILVLIQGMRSDVYPSGT